MADISVLHVLLHDEEIGTLTQLPGDRSIFSFTEAYIGDHERATLSLSFKDPYGNLITDHRTTQTRVLPFFANLLPEAHLRDYLAARAGVKSVRDFPLLWALGEDLPGAIRIVSADGESWPKDDAKANLDVSDENTPLRFSLAGVQLKFSALMEASGGLTIPTRGVGGHWIIKLPSNSYSAVPENEFAMMTLAGKVGIDVPDIKLVDLVEIEGLPEGIGSLTGQAFAIRRFDRTEDSSVHIEDFAQIYGVYPDRKYEKASYRNIADVVWIETGEAGLAEFIRRLVFNILIGNADMHLKNWSLIYPDKVNAQLAPAYDFVSTIAFMENDKLALTFGRSKKWEDVSEDELHWFSGKAKLPRKLVLDTARKTVADFLAAWSKEKGQLTLTKDARGRIDKHLEKVPLVRNLS
ncbi:MAG: HipA domain-containing protein [Pseudomonadaceae bacterium]|nr:HipA domain-containing protein [Pseudomonadaceae bacterium]